MRRFGERLKSDITYKKRVGVYGIIRVDNDLLLTEQDNDEIQLPGGGSDPNEHLLHTLIRETLEETGWKIQPKRRIGVYQRFVFMPEYNFWAHKICHIYHCEGIYPTNYKLEQGHLPIISSPEQAITLLESEGDRFFVKKFYQL